MASAVELKKILDDRLVNGNISIDEYREMAVIVGLPALPKVVAEVESELDTLAEELIEEEAIDKEIDNISTQREILLMKMKGSQKELEEKSPKVVQVDRTPYESSEDHPLKPAVESKPVTTIKQTRRLVASPGIMDKLQSGQKLTSGEKLKLTGATLFILFLFMIFVAFINAL